MSVRITLCRASKHQAQNQAEQIGLFATNMKPQMFKVPLLSQDALHQTFQIKQMILDLKSLELVILF